VRQAEQRHASIEIQPSLSLLGTMGISSPKARTQSTAASTAKLSPLASTFVVPCFGELVQLQLSVLKHRSIGTFGNNSPKLQRHFEGY